MEPQQQNETSDAQQDKNEVVLEVEQTVAENNNHTLEHKKDEAKNKGFVPSIKQYFRKWKGKGRPNNSRGPAHYGVVKITKEQLAEFFWSWIGGFCGIAAVSLLHYYVFLTRNLAFVIGSFGASAVLIYGVPKSPLAQPRNLIGGHFISACVGCICKVAFVNSVGVWFAISVAVPTAIVAMQLTDTVHPPGGATALLAVLNVAETAWGGFLFIFIPTLSGALVMLLVALIVNNIPKKGVYPQYFW